MRKFNVTVNGKPYEVEVEEVGSSASEAPAVQSAPTVSTPAAPAPAKPAGGGTPIKSPMPGLILSLAHSDGDSVKKDEKLLVLEAMKMENDINSVCDGKVTYAVKKGDNVETGTILAYVG